MKFTLAHSATCLPSYWGGHHLAHISVGVDNAMTGKQLRAALLSELNQDAVAGANAGQITESDEGYQAAKDAVNNLQFLAGDNARIFPDLPDDESSDGDSIQAYFVFMPHHD